MSLVLLGVVASFLLSWGVEIARALLDDGSGNNVLPVLSELDGFYRDPEVEGQYDFDMLQVELGRTVWTRHRMHKDGRRYPDFVEYPSWFKPPPFGEGIGRTAYAYGIPFRCMRWEEITYGKLWPKDPSPYRYSIRWDCGWFDARIPLRPIWPGLLANTLVFAALFSIPWTLRAVCRRRRLRRGHCPFCNYDLRGEFSKPCTECGRSVKPKGPVTV